jgi:hypothetical protein
MMSQDNDLTPEAREVQSFFKDSGQIAVDEEKKRVEKAIDISMPNQGAEMTIEFETRTTGPNLNYQQLCSALPPQVDMDPPKAPPPSLEIRDLGGEGDGLDLSGIF